MTAARPGADLRPHLLDLHVHTRMSDGQLSLEEVVALSRERGLRVGIADHVSTRKGDLFVSTPAAFERYLRALAGAPVLRGAEFCWLDPLPERLPRTLTDRLQYRIGSNHGFRLPDGSLSEMWADELPERWRREPDRWMDALVAGLCELVETMGVDIIGHPTLLPPGLLALDPDLDRWWTAGREDRLVEAVIRSGVAVEISDRYRLPHDRLLRKVLEAGGRFSLGSDAHTAGQVARLDWSRATAARVGIERERLFVPDAAGGR